MMSCTMPISNAPATYATGITGSNAATICMYLLRRVGRRLYVNHAIHVTIIDKMHKHGNETMINALAHAAGLFIEPGASNIIGESNAPRSPGINSNPQMTVTTIATVGLAGCSSIAGSRFWQRG